MYEFQYQDVRYPEEALGWVNGVYHPRRAQTVPGSSFMEMAEGIYRFHSRVWREIEETGFGIYDYAETTHLAARLEGANYRVEAVFVNPASSAYTCHIRLNGVVKNPEVTVAPGEEKRVAFTACMTDGSFSLSFPVGSMLSGDGASAAAGGFVIGGEAIEGCVCLKDVAVVPEEARERRERPHVFLVSDSTVQSYARRFYPQTGWGQVFCGFFRGAEECVECPAQNCEYSIAKTYELPELVIENRAIGGRSARSFYDEGKLDQILEVICPGDFMFVQFAHNDDNARRPNRYIAPEEFPAFLRHYADACERRGAQCVLVTPVTMRVKGEDGKFKIAFGNYREKMMELAEERDIPLLDLAARSTAYLNEIGEEAGKGLYLWTEEGEYPDGAYAAGVSDNAHLQEYGAKVYANMVVQMIAEYSRDNRLDVLQKLAAPQDVGEIEKPRGGRQFHGDSAGKAVGDPADRAGSADGVEGFVAQEISVENGRGNFLLNWNCREGAASYTVYARKKGETGWELAKAVTREEKDSCATLPFCAEAGLVWEYYVSALGDDGQEMGAGRVIEVDLAGDPAE